MKKITLYMEATMTFDTGWLVPYTIGKRANKFAVRFLAAPPFATKIFAFTKMLFRYPLAQHEVLSQTRS
jgi:hypothetical protein